jgi:drug/metabolite transporter (DMT)-like permease
MKTTVWYQSKTIWAAVITGVAGVAMAVIGEGVVNEQVAGGILIAVGLLNTVLRRLTTKPLTI